jgi:hypothetical protein
MLVYPSGYARKPPCSPGLSENWADQPKIQVHEQHNLGAHPWIQSQLLSQPPLVSMWLIWTWTFCVFNCWIPSVLLISAHRIQSFQPLSYSFKYIHTHIYIHVCRSINYQWNDWTYQLIEHILWSHVTGYCCCWFHKVTKTPTPKSCWKLRHHNPTGRCPKVRQLVYNQA